MATVLKVLEQSAHRALQTADILHEVMAYLDVNHDIPGCTHVCWAWFPVAICFRWKTIKKTLPLARLLGSIVFQGDTWSFASQPGPQEWDRFYLYSSKVRYYLCGGWSIKAGPLNDWNTYAISSTASDIFIAPPAYVKRPLFPLLQTIGDHESWQSYDLGSEFHVPLIRVLLESHLVQKMDLLSMTPSVFPPTTDNPQPPLTTLSSLAPSLGPGTSAAGNDKLQFLANLESICYLITVTPEFLLEISHLPKLKKLRFVPPMNLQAPVMAHVNFDEDLFPSLQHLETEFDDVSQLEIILASPRHLKHFTARLRSPRYLQKLLGQAEKWQDTLQSLTLSGSSFAMRDVIQYKDLASITSLQNLRALHMSELGPFRITDSELEKLVMCLPSLRHLALLCDAQYGSNEHTLTILSVYHIVQHCRNIEEITFNFNAEHIPSVTPASSQRAGEKANRELLRLDVQSSSIQEPDGISMWLRKCCSRFERVDIVASYSDWTSHWSVVHNRFASNTFL